MRVLVFGSTGSAGGSVLKACLATPEVREVRSITRRPLALDHPKLRSVVHANFADYRNLPELFTGLSACLYCLGVSATQVRDEDRYRRITRDYSVAAAGAVREGSPNAPFHFVSGAGTRSDSRYMWARVKAEAEQEVMKASDAACWRAGFIDGEPSSNGAWYLGALQPAFRLLRSFRGLYVTGEDLGLAMLQATREGIWGRVIENREIRSLAERWKAIKGAAAHRGGR